MNAISFALVLTGVLLNAAAQLLLKRGTQATGEITLQSDLIHTATRILLEPAFLGGFACYGISIIIWIVALSKVPVSVAYPMLSIGYVVNAIIAHYWFGEAVSALKLGGIGLIVIGVICVARS